MLSQNDDETFRKNCDRIIENNGDMEKTEKIVREMLGQGAIYI